jgi:hypothetical protein
MEPGELVWVQNPKTKRWDRAGVILIESYPKIRRYLMRTEAGGVFKRNRVHLRKRWPYVIARLLHNTVSILLSKIRRPKTILVMSPRSLQGTILVPL